MRVELSERAEADIDAHTTYGNERFGSAQTERYFWGLERVFELLADDPAMGQPVRGGARRFVYKTHYVYYRLEPSRIFVTTVRSARMRPPD